MWTRSATSRGPTTPRPSLRRRATSAPVIDDVLRPGDALYVPRGFLHSAKALGGVSAHLTVGLHTMTRYLLVQELAALAADEPALRTALPLGFDPGDPAQLAEVLQEVTALLIAHLSRPRSTTWRRASAAVPGLPIAPSRFRRLPTRLRSTLWQPALQSACGAGSGIG